MPLLTRTYCPEPSCLTPYQIGDQFCYKCGRDRDTVSPEALLVEELPRGVTIKQNLQKHTDWIDRITFSPDGQILASGGRDTIIRLWDINTGVEIDSLEGHTGEVNSLIFSPDGRILASGEGNTEVGSFELTSPGQKLKLKSGSVCLWNVNTREKIYTLPGLSARVLSLAFSPDGQLLASSGGDTTIRLWDVNTGVEIDSLEGHTGEVNSLIFSPDGQVLASGSDDSTIRLWDVEARAEIKKLSGHTSWITSLAFSPDGQVLASGSHDTTIRIWNIQTRSIRQILEGHSKEVSSLSFFSDGRTLASKGGNVRLWDSITYNQLAIINEPQGKAWPSSLAFHPELPLLATVGSKPETPPDECDREIHIYQIDIPFLLGQAPTIKAITSTSAKVVLMGDSSVGKSCLAMRLVEDRYPNADEHGTTHGMRFWPMTPEQLHASAIPPEGERREIVLWDLGGQDEYQLVHQLFLAETTLALVLIDPTRGRKAFEDAEAWITRLDKQLKGKPCVKLLIGAKLDELNSGLSHTSIQNLCGMCGFADFLETSALNGRGAEELKEAIAKHIPWEDLGTTRRPELFQQIRDEIEVRQQRGETVLYESDLLVALGFNRALQIKALKSAQAVRDESAIQAVVDQLSRQGVIARSKVTTGDPVLVLQIQEVERYAGSIILAAKQNPRVVPMLELTALMHPSFTFPRLGQRLERAQERVVLECTVQLLLEHGICFAHQGLLIFPSCFPEASDTNPAPLPYSVSLYYDFSGAINNVYASLVTSLVLAERFGGVRLWPDRAEFETGDSGLCGIRKIARPGGFAHMDLFFEEKTPDDRKALFTSFVEEHLREHDIDIREVLAIKCTCGYTFDEGLVRERIALAKQSINCPRCDTPNEILEGASKHRETDPQLTRKTLALRTDADKRRARTTQEVVSAMSKSDDSKPQDTTTPIRLLHLSDLHFTKDTPVDARLQWLLQDLKEDDVLGKNPLDYIVVSGDFTDRHEPVGFTKALSFLRRLQEETGVSPERFILVPGNHDVDEPENAFKIYSSKNGLTEGHYTETGGFIIGRDPEHYTKRFTAFSEQLYHAFYQTTPYPLEHNKQGIALPFLEARLPLQFLLFNSCWELDKTNRKRSGIHPEAIAHAIAQADKQHKLVVASGKLDASAPILRIAVWHHAVAGAEQMKDTDFIGHLQKAGVRFGLHGDVHELRRDWVGYQNQTRLPILGAGSFASPHSGLPPATPRLYSLIEIATDFTSAIVKTREQRRPDGPWQGWYEWPTPDGAGRLPYYDLTL